MPITKKIKDLHQKMTQLHIVEDDLTEKFILGSGKGGQKINKTASCREFSLKRFNTHFYPKISLPISLSNTRYQRLPLS